MRRIVLFLLLTLGATEARSFSAFQEMCRDTLPAPSYEAGKQAASTAYKTDGWAIAGIYLSSFYFTPVAGLIVTLLTTAKRPRQLTFPDQPTAPAFRRGFEDGAFQKKKRKLWLHFVISAVVFGIGFLVFLAVMNSLFDSFRL